MSIRVLALIVLCLPLSALGEILSSSDSHYEIKLQAESPESPEAVWARLVEPATWWHPDHTFSGDSQNLTLHVEAGGLWREDWSGGSVAHGEVLYVQHGKTLRLSAPFGPLAGVGAYTVWTISIEANGEGSTVTFHEVSQAPPTAKLAELAEAVHYVKTEAMRRLVATPDD